MPATQALTVIAEIDPAQRARLDERLLAIRTSLDGNDVFRPGDLPDTHFTRFVVIDDREHELPALLAWEVNHDGEAAEYLAEVARTVPAIDRVLECCLDYPAGGCADTAVWLRWMQARSHRAAAFYAGYRGIPRRRVVNDRRVHDALRAIVDRDRAELAGQTPPEVRRRLLERARAEYPDLELEPPGDLAGRWLLARLVAIAGTLVALPFALLALGPWYLMLRAHERRDPASRAHRPVHDDHHYQDDEDKVAQNQFTHLVDLKPGGFRLFTAWIVLTVIDVLARVVFVEGSLGGITSIHFARWVILRDRRPNVARRRHRLLFFSNYDGSWESYLGEFIDRAARGLTGVWSNTKDFPRTRNLVGAGALDEEAFKQWTRDHQIPTQVWWSGVPDSTVQNVLDDLALRAGLDGALGDDEVQGWLDRL